MSLRLVNTVRYLKLRQITYRLYYKFWAPRVMTSPACTRRPWPHAWIAPAVLPSTMRASGCFEFLGEHGCVANERGWNLSGKSKLWLYNLHYLDDLNAVGAESRYEQHRALIDCWIAENPSSIGLGWEPYPLSLRIVNLVKWFGRWGLAEPRLLESLALQAHALSKRIEFHLLGNHVLANAKALVFAGAFLAGDAPNRWLERGVRILDREIPEQFLSDGGHFELSPMYQAIVLADLCDLLNLARLSGLEVLRERADEWRAKLARGLAWLSTITHPDGAFGFFNDTALNVAPALHSLYDYAAIVGCDAREAATRSDVAVSKVALRRLESSGYYRVDMPRATVALLDVARVGPDYLPGHAHADTLSFELSIHAQRTIVNSGTSLYGDCAERHRQRGTAAHNTVLIDGVDSSEVWGAFRVARRAYPTLHAITETEDSIVLEASHDGYRRLPGNVVHRRRWTFTQTAVTVHDMLSGRFKSAEAYFHIHPDVQVEEDASMRGVRLILRSGQQVIVLADGAKRLELRRSTWHPMFGASVPNICIVAPFATKSLNVKIAWTRNA